MKEYLWKSGSHMGIWGCSPKHSHLLPWFHGDFPIPAGWWSGLFPSGIPMRMKNPGATSEKITKWNGASVIFHPAQEQVRNYKWAVWQQCTWSRAAGDSLLLNSSSQYSLHHVSAVSSNAAEESLQSIDSPTDSNEMFQTCGQPEIPRMLQRIYGGTKTKAGKHPWVASLQMKSSPGGEHFCGGVLIEACWVLTAGHCVE